MRSTPGLGGQLNGQPLPRRQTLVIGLLNQILANQQRFFATLTYLPHLENLRRQLELPNLYAIAGCLPDARNRGWLTCILSSQHLCTFPEDCSINHEVRAHHLHCCEAALTVSGARLLVTSQWGHELGG